MELHFRLAVSSTFAGHQIVIAKRQILMLQTSNMKSVTYKKKGNCEKKTRLRSVLPHVAGQIPSGVVQVHESSVDIRHRLNDILQALAQVVAVAQTRAFVEHDVDFDVELVAAVVGLETLDGLDGFGEAHGEVKQDVALIGGRCSAGEVADVL